MHGASGETRNEIERALGSTEFSNLINQIESDSSIESANKIFVATRFSLKPDYQQTVETIFKSKAQSVYFGDSTGTSKAINDWIEKKTHGLIKDLVKDLEPDLVAIVINVIYFKGAWVFPFELQDEDKRDFYHSKSRKTELNFMTVEEDLNYALLSDQKVQILELPYKSSDIKMVILLPEEIDGLKDLEESLTAETLNFMLSKMEIIGTVLVELPRFKITFDSSLYEVFKEVG